MTYLHTQYSQTAKAVAVVILDILKECDRAMEVAEMLPEIQKRMGRDISRHAATRACVYARDELGALRSHSGTTNKPLQYQLTEEAKSA